MYFVGIFLVVSSLLLLILGNVVPASWFERTGTESPGPPVASPDGEELLEEDEEERRFRELQGQTYFRGIEINIGALAAAKGSRFIGLTFENCRLVGPGVIAFTGRPVVDGLTIDSFITDEIEHFLYQIQPGRLMAGVIDFRDCILRNVVIYNIGIAGSHDALNEIRHAFGSPPRPREGELT